MNPTALNEAKSITSTDLEYTVLVELIRCLYAEPGFSDVDCKELAANLELPVNRVKGVIGSLTKKGIVYVGEDDFADIVYLERKYWYLHPEWWIVEESRGQAETDAAQLRREQGI